MPYQLLGCIAARLVKELRLAGVSTMEAANAFVPGFLAAHNARFARAPANPKDLHRPLRAKDRLEDAFAWRVERHVSRNLTLQYDKVLFILEDTPEARDAAGKKAEVSDFPDGRVEVRYKGALLPYHTFDKLRRVHQAPVVDNKRLAATLDWCREQQALVEPEGRSRKAPARRDQKPSRIYFAS